MMSRCRRREEDPMMTASSTTTTTTDPSCPCGDDDTVHQLPNKRNRALFKRHRGPVLLLLSCLSSWNHHFHLQLAGSFSAERRHPKRWTTTGHQHCPHSHLNFLPLFATQQQSQSPAVTFLEEEESRKNPLLDPETTSQIQLLLEQRAKARWNGDYAEADGLRDRLLLTVSDDDEDDQQAKAKLLPDGVTLWLQDLPRTQGGGTQWKVLTLEEEQSKDPPDLLPGPTVLQLAHAALGLAVEHSTHIHRQRALKATTRTTSLSNESDDDDDMPQGGFISNPHTAVSYQEQLQSIVNQIRDRLDHQSQAAVAYELAGRKAADAAFWLALAGVSGGDDDDSSRMIYSELTHVATQELKRFGDRPSCRVKDVHQILERFAAAGIQKSPELLDVAQRCLELKEQGSSKSDTDIKSMLDFHSDRSLLLIWKFSTKQKKQRAFLQSAVKHWERHRENGRDTLDNNNNNNNNDPFKGEEGLRNSSFALEGSNNNVIWSDIFEDPTRPLVVDIGCGMGVSLLGLSCSKDTTGSKILLNTNRSSNTNTEVEWKDCNFVGVDLGALGIGYARAMAERWGIQGRTHFTVDAAEDFITKILGSGEDDVTNLSYPGPIRLVLIQFPTPYRLPKGDGDGGGNAQLPSSALDGFMVSPKLLQSVQKLLTRDRGRLLLQSNCEDVALWMRRTACDVADFEIVSLKQDEESSSPNQPQSPAVPERIPQRTADWIAMGGERAKGKGWYKHPLLPRKGATETEVACLLNGTPVHRTILQPKG